MQATHLLVGNPAAQSGKNAERIDLALRLLKEAGISAELFSTLPEGRTVGALKDALDSGAHRVVIAMGGDGTFREVASGVLSSARHESLTLGLLPTGTANDQARSFGLDPAPSELAANVAVLATGHEGGLDAGALRGGEPPSDPVYFFDSAGWGLSARVLAQRNRDRRTVATLGPTELFYRDHAVYAGALLKTFLESYVVPDKMHVTLVLDGVKHELEGVSDIIVKNTRIYAGAWALDRTARHDDGLFEIVPFRGKRDWTSKAIVDLEGSPITEAMLNELGIEHSHPLRGASIDLELTPPPGGAPLAAQLDGEEWPVSPKVRINVLPRALRMIVPV